MIKPDLIVKQPLNVDFPKWRAWIRKNRNYFNKLIVVFVPSANTGPNVENFIRSTLTKDNAIFLKPKVRISWDHDCIHAGLAISDTEYFCLMHQDFIFKNDNLLPAILSCTEDVISFRDNTDDPAGRFNNAWIVMRREAFNKTSQQIYPAIDKHGRLRDSGGVVSVELREFASIKEIDTLEGFSRDIDWFHMTGLTFRYGLMYISPAEEKRVLPSTITWEELGKYHRECLELEIEQYEPFVRYMKDSINRHCKRED